MWTSIDYLIATLILAALFGSFAIAAFDPWRGENGNTDSSETEQF